MPITVILVRHGRTTANATGLLAGRTPGVQLDETGQQQAADAARRIADVPLAKLVASPLERCQQTAAAIGAHYVDLDITSDDALSEVDYGSWQGRPLAELATEELWKDVQGHPSSVVFPGGESMRTMQTRAVDAIRRHNESIRGDHGNNAVWAAVSHGDIIKSIVADAYGMHLDLFQRVQVDPASVTVISYGRTRPHVVCVNTHAGDLSWLKAAAPDDAPVGGGAGPQERS